MVGLRTPTICWVTPFFEAETYVFSKSQIHAKIHGYLELDSLR